MNLFEKLLAFDFERNQICTVYNVNIEPAHDQYGKVLMNNGHVTFSKNHLLKECIILEWTGQLDSQKERIIRYDLVEDEETIYIVEWHQQQACWWLTPLKLKNPVKDGSETDFIVLTIGNQSLGNGYYSRKDLTKIGNYLVDKQKFDLHHDFGI